MPAGQNQRLTLPAVNDRAGSPGCTLGILHPQAGGCLQQSLPEAGFGFGSQRWRGWDRLTGLGLTTLTQGTFKRTGGRAASHRASQSCRGLSGRLASRLGEERRGGLLSWHRHARNLLCSRHRGHCRQRGQAKGLTAFRQQCFEFISRGSAVNPADLVPLHQEDVAGHASHVESLDKIVLMIDIDMPNQPAGSADLANQRGHLPAGTTPVRREVEQDNVTTGGCRHGRTLLGKRGRCR